MQLTLIIISIILALICVYLYTKNNKISYILKQNLEKNEELNKILEKKEIELNIAKQKEYELNSLKAILDEKNKQIEEAKKEKIELKNDYDKNLKELKKELEEQFKQQQKILIDQNKIVLGGEGRKIFEDIFKPLDEKVKEYNEKLQANEISLKTNIKNMFEYSQKIGEQADEFSKILKGEKKIRGNFAEMQLKSVLENSGLKEGEQYKLQEHFKNEGKSYYPDAVVFLDKNKSIIIDAKFSLPNNFDLKENEEKICQEIAKNLKSRIDELASKPYSDFDLYTYDFVLLFIPYQNILDLALEENPYIYQYAYSKKIYLTTPNTLFMALNTINITWKHINSNDNMQKAFKALGGIYDKFSIFIDYFDGIKNAAETLNNKISNADKTLKEGKGNLYSKISSLKDYGAITKKELKNDNFLLSEDE